MSNDILAPLFVIAGPSGVGKTTIAERVLATSGLPLRRAITATTRAHRPGEVDGKDYHFWTVQQFHDALAGNEMLEHAIVHGRDFYGTPRAEVEPFRIAGTGVLLLIDVQGASHIRSLKLPKFYTIFLTVSDWSALEKRLELRGEAKESIERRLRSAHAEATHANEFDVVIFNHDLDATVAECTNYIRARL